MADEAITALPIVQTGYGKGWPLVQGECPSCGVRALFLGSSGYVTCGAPTCGHPAAASDLLDPHWQDALRATKRDDEQPFGDTDASANGGAE